MAGKELPKTIYGVWRYDSPDDPFLETDEDPAILAEKDKSIVVGEYQLTKNVMIKNTTEVT
ncbi:MAG: hypothetical protein V3U75_04225 [Methylococcaceae bacterium]